MPTAFLCDVISLFGRVVEFWPSRMNTNKARSAVKAGDTIAIEEMLNEGGI